MSYDDQNVFAKILRGEIPCNRVYETDTILAFMDIMPRGNGHVLVIPKIPVRTIVDIAPDDLAELAKAVQIVAKGAARAFDADGITIQQFNESAGGQVVFHLHFHIIPRWNGVPLRPHTGEMEKAETLKANAEKLAAALGA